MTDSPVDINALRYMYHGTNPSWIAKILKGGIKPRSITKKSNWNERPEYMSRSDMVYLTYSYPLYFSMAATSGLRFAVIEVDLQKLDENNFYPDEDPVAQATAKLNKLKLRDVHTVIRNKLEDIKHMWKASVLSMGTLAHSGTIPPEAISRYAIVNLKQVALSSLFFSAVDTQISIMNFLLRGEWPHQVVEWLFGDRQTHPQYDEMLQLRSLYKGEMKKRICETLKEIGKHQTNMQGINIVTCNDRAHSK